MRFAVGMVSFSEDSSLWKCYTGVYRVEGGEDLCGLLRVGDDSAELDGAIGGEGEVWGKELS